MDLTKEKIIIAILLALLIWFGTTIVLLENYHYASQLGFCQEYDLDLVGRDECLEKVETRTSWIWHLLYGLRILQEFKTPSVS